MIKERDGERLDCFAFVQSRLGMLKCDRTSDRTRLPGEWVAVRTDTIDQ